MDTKQQSETFSNKLTRTLVTMALIASGIVVTNACVGCSSKTPNNESANVATTTNTAQDPKGMPQSDDANLSWDETRAPNYVERTGSAEFENETTSLTKGTYQTHADDMGRPSLVTANIDNDMAQEGSSRKRDDLPNPLGWPKNKEVDIEMCDGTYHGWLFNRSHLLAKSLGGPDTKENLVTGTRCQNVGSNDGTGGMGLPETLARNWLKNHKDGTIYYEVEPNYVNDEPIPRTVSVDIKTSDNEIDAHFVTYNCAKGFEIDYKTGTWKQL